MAACKIDGHYDPIDAAPDPDAPISPDGSPPPEMVSVPGGPFTRGCNQAVEDCSNLTDQVPLAMITVSTFTIDGTEVTQAAYKLCIDAGKCTAPSTAFDPLNKGSHPVGGVTWQQAVDYCAHKGKRLPTEAEWEKASRGTDGRKYPWGNFESTCQLSHYLDCALGDTSSLPVGSKAGDSPFGLKDMGGNVSEWVSDWWNNQFYSTSPTMDPQGPPTGTYKVIRGGGFGYGSRYLRSSNRFFGNPTTATAGVGFRCARN
jgi:formylglycine-generating enzyme required for sulfatase activity